MAHDTSENNEFIPLAFRVYEEKAMEYRLPSADDVYAVYNLAGEVGELASKLAKVRRDGMPTAKNAISEHRSAVKKEIGDILWMLTAICRDNNATLEECALINLVKLRDRQAKGTLQGSGDDR